MIQVSCPLCGSPHSSRLATFRDWTYRIGGDFHAVRCRTCGHRYLNPRPSDQHLLDYYPTDYAPHHGDYAPHHGESDLPHGVKSPPVAGPSSPTLPDSRKRFVWARRCWRAWLDNRSTWKPDRVDLDDACRPKAVELGCADGWFCEELIKEGWCVEGIEPVPAAAARARRRGITVHVGSALQAPIPPQSVDFVASWMVLEHLADPVGTVARIASWIKPGGWFAFSVPNAASLDRFLFQHHWSGFDGGRHLQFYSPVSLTSMLKLHSFESIRFIHQNTAQPWLGSLGSWVDALAPGGKLARAMARTYMFEVSFRSRILLSPWSNLVAGLRLASRITVVARKTPSLREGSLFSK